MPAELSIDAFEPLAWVNEYTRPATPIDETHFSPILHFSLMWNLFERDACRRNATPLQIERAANVLVAPESFSLAPFQEHLQYFTDRAQQNGMTIDKYLVALNVKSKERCLVHGVLAGALTDPKDVVRALLLIAHRIRNNLFHGEKIVADLHSQVGLFRTANSLLATYLSVKKNAA